jgi:glycosyltransferase involved in cell wall biosynthesis
MKKILLVSHSQKSGGAERCLLEAAIGLSKRGYKVLTVVPSAAELYELLKDHKLDVIVFSHPWWVHFGKEKFSSLKKIRKSIALAKYVLRANRVLADYKPDLVISNTLCIPTWAIAAKMRGLKHHWFIHEFGEEDHGLWFDYGIRFSTKVINVTSAHVYVNSNLLKQKFKKYIPEDKFSIVNYNIPEPLVEHVQKETVETNLLLVGQIKKSKGQDDAVRAVKVLREQGVDVQLALTGSIIDVDYYEDLRSFITQAGLSDNVKFEAHSNRPFKVYNGLNIGLMCSRKEALGRVTIEYMKARIPVIAADAGTTKELVSNRITGLLYSVGDVEDLVEKIKTLIRDQALRTKIIEKAQEFARTEFNEEKFLNGIIEPLKLKPDA